jgi:uncharacterized Rossmann fold enzyme
MDDYLSELHVNNPDASGALRIRLYPNTPAAEVLENIKVNAAQPLSWLAMTEPHDGVIAIVGGGPSANDHVALIDSEQKRGATVMALNGASKWLNAHGIKPDYQMIIDSKPETADLVDPEAADHLFASQVNPDTLAKAPNAKLCHLNIEGIGECLPERGGEFALLGGGLTVGNSAICAAYVMGYRNVHLYGFDGSHKSGKGHAYAQPMNDDIPVMDVTFQGQDYQASIVMKAAAETFLTLVNELEAAGVNLNIYGDGLIPAMYRATRKVEAEADKYSLMWEFDSYRNASPAEDILEEIAAFLPPSSKVIDLGCGTGRAALALTKCGHDVFCVDFASNARDKEAEALPFLEWDLSTPLPIRAPYGYCCDVMEHIPPDQVEAVLGNIAEAVENVLFRIEFNPDSFGPATLGRPLHLSVHGSEWWCEALQKHFHSVEYAGNGIFKATR